MTLDSILNNAHNSIKDTIGFLDKERGISLEEKLDMLARHLPSFEEGIRIGSQGIAPEPEIQSITLKFIHHIINQFNNALINDHEAWDYLRGYFRLDVIDMGPDVT